MPPAKRPYRFIGRPLGNPRNPIEDQVPGLDIRTTPIGATVPLGLTPEQEALAISAGVIRLIPPSEDPALLTEEPDVR